MLNIIGLFPIAEAIRADIYLRVDDIRTDVVEEVLLVHRNIFHQ